jgi:hypothetical protein
MPIFAPALVVARLIDYSRSYNLEKMGCRGGLLCATNHCARAYPRDLMAYAGILALNRTALENFS